MEELQWGAFAFGFILGVVVTALAMSKKTREGFRDLVLGVYNKLTKKGGKK